VDKHPDLKKEQRITTKKVIITSVVVDVLDVILNFSVAILSGSVVMMTQVLEGVSDLASSGLLLVGFNRFCRKRIEAILLATEQKYIFGVFCQR